MKSNKAKKSVMVLSMVLMGSLALSGCGDKNEPKPANTTPVSSPTTPAAPITPDEQAMSRTTDPSGHDNIYEE